MPTAPDTELISFNNWTLRIRKTEHPVPRLLVMIHGFTGDENSMWVFARDLPTDYWIIAPRAPSAASPSGYTWNPLQLTSEKRPSLEQLRSSAEALINLIDAYQLSAGLEAHPERRQRFDVIGFSQGAVMSSLLTFLYPHRIGKTGILSGFVPSGLEELVTRRPLEGKPFFVAHGTQDQTVPIERARASLQILEQAGAHITYCEDAVGHKVSLNCLRALKDFLAE